MALAVELSQLGLAPERVVRLLKLDPFPVFMCVRMAAAELLRVENAVDEGKPAMPMYLYFDPGALTDLTFDWDVAETPDSDRAVSTFHYGGPGVVAELLAGWIAGENTRAAFLNVTRVLDGLLGPDFSNREGLLVTARRRFLSDIIRWSDDLEDTYADDDFIDFLYRFALESLPDLMSESDTSEHRQKGRAALEAMAEELNFPPRIVDAVEHRLRSPETFLGKGGHFDVGS